MRNNPDADRADWPGWIEKDRTPHCERPVSPSRAGREMHRKLGTPLCERCRVSDLWGQWERRHPDADPQDWPDLQPALDLEVKNDDGETMQLAPDHEVREVQNPHCAKPVNSSGAGRNWHFKHGTPICERCRQSQRNADREQSARRRGGRARQHAQDKMVEQPDRYVMFKKLERYNAELEFLANSSMRLATYEWDEDDLPHVRDSLVWAREVLDDAAAAWDRRDEVHGLRLRIEKLEALAANADEHEAAAARAGAERTRAKLKLVQGGLASD